MYKPAKQAWKNLKKGAVMPIIRYVMELSA
jgi:hypothetical protein